MPVKKKRGPPKGSGGRPSKYTPEIAERMCEMLSQGIPLREICRQEGFPEWRTVYDWMVRDAHLSAAIARAREVGQEAIAEGIYELVERPPERIVDDKGVSRVDAGYVQWTRVQADIKLKLLAKWNPKRYGDRVAVAGDAENPVQIQHDVKTVFDNLLKNMELRRQQEAADDQN